MDQEKANLRDLLPVREDVAVLKQQLPQVLEQLKKLTDEVDRSNRSVLPFTASVNATLKALDEHLVRTDGQVEIISDATASLTESVADLKSGVAELKQWRSSAMKVVGGVATGISIVFTAGVSALFRYVLPDR